MAQSASCSPQCQYRHVVRSTSPGNCVVDQHDRSETSPSRAPGRHVLASLMAALSIGLMLSGCGSVATDPTARETAEWVLAKGGTLHVVERTVEVKEARELPEEDFGIARIQLKAADIKDADMKHFSELKNLKYLGLYNNPITDKGLQELEAVTTLQELELSQTRISDKSADTLGGLSNLQKLFLRNTLVTEKGLEELKIRLPECKIYH